MIVRALKLPPVTRDAPTFADTAGHWVDTQGFLEAAVQAGLVNPSEYGATFAPDQPIDREAMAVMAARAPGQRAEQWSGPSAAGDAAEIGAGDLPYVVAAQSLKIITGFPDGTFRPHDTATRAQATVIVLRVVDYLAAHQQ